MQDSESSKPDPNEPQVPSPEPSPAPEQAQRPFIPNMGIREVTATWEMLVKFKEAILNVQWPGEYVQAVGMGLEMVKQMESQYRVQVDMARRNAEADRKSAKAAIAKAGGAILGEPTPANVG